MHLFEGRPYRYRIPVTAEASRVLEAHSAGFRGAWDLAQSALLFAYRKRRPLSIAMDFEDARRRELSIRFDLSALGLGSRWMGMALHSELPLYAERMRAGRRDESGRKGVEISVRLPDAALDVLSMRAFERGTTLYDELAESLDRSAILEAEDLKLCTGRARELSLTVGREPFDRLREVGSMVSMRAASGATARLIRDLSAGGVA